MHKFNSHHPTVEILQMRTAAYPTLHIFCSQHPTVIILQMRRAAYPNVHTFNSHHPTVAILQMRIAGLCHCAHTTARKGTPIPLCTFFALTIPL